MAATKKKTEATETEPKSTVTVYGDIPRGLHIAVRMQMMRHSMTWPEVLEDALEDWMRPRELHPRNRAGGK